MGEGDSVLTNSTSVEPEEGKKEHLPEDLCLSMQTTPQRSSSRASWEISEDPVAQGTTNNSTPIKSQASPSPKCVQTKKPNKQSLQAKTTPTQSLHSRRPEKEKKDTSAGKDPIVGHEPRGKNSTYHLSAISRQKEAEDTKFVSNAKERVAGQHQTLRSGGSGSTRKTIKTSYKKAAETCSRLSGKESLSSLGTDRKAEWKLLEKRNSLIHANKKYKFASGGELSSNEEERRAQCRAALIMGQKRLGDRTEMLKNSLNSTSFADSRELGFNLRSSIFQGGPLECRSLMKDSYTPDIIQKAVRDPNNWHGRRTDELGKWHEKNALNLNLQKALEEKYGKKKGKP
ncbi:testis-expressed protein 33 isoform X2 [Tyto alba]|nr:testis-expressed protein 33 isoform X2 [Tyto alba]